MWFGFASKNRREKETKNLNINKIEGQVLTKPITPSFRPLH